MLRFSRGSSFASNVAILTLALFLILLGIVQAAPLLRPLLAPGNPITDPPGNTHTAPPTTTVSITYDEPISPTTVSIQTFAVFASQTGLLTQTYGVVSGTITLTPTLPLKPGELVQVSATTGTLNLSGQGPISPTVWQFWTRVDGGSGIFAPHPSAPTFGGGSRAAVVLGDVDGDNDLDVVDASGDSQRVYLNDGTGQFTPHPIAPTFGGGNSIDLALGDIDGDGDLDAVVANYNQAQGVYVNDGTGLFVPHPIAPTFGDGYSYDLVLGDVDGDSDLDAVVGNGTYHATYVNDGTGQFSPHPDTPTFSTGTYFTDLSMGDVDGDGDLDIVAAQASSSPQQVHLNDGTGQFAPHPTAPTFGAGNSFALALGDVDGDGDLDAIVGNSDSDLVLYLNDGTGQFSLHPTDPTFGSGSVQVVTLGDVDGDGDLDAIVSHGAAGIYIYRNAGTGQFTSHSFFSDDEFIALGDVDDDGDLDIVTADGYTSPDRVWLNRSAADLGIAKSVVPTGILGRSDAITYTLTYSNAGAQIASGVVITDLVPVTVTQISFARSGALVTPTGSISYTWQMQDLAPGTGGVITIYGRISSMVTGLFTLTNQATITTTRLDVMDVNKDNNEAAAYSQVVAEPTIVTGVTPAPNTHAVSTSTNLSVTFSAPISTTTVTSRTLFVHGGFHGHILGAIYPPITGTLHWDDITFDPSGDFSPGELVQATASTGILDASDNAPVLPYVWQFWAGVGGGSGYFGNSGQSLGSSRSYAVALGDLDGDGDLDAFVGNGRDQSNRVWLNNGGVQGGTPGTFSDSGQSLGSSFSQAVALGDLDGDGDLDAFVANSDQGNEVWLNNGGVQGGTPGTFSDSGQSLGSSPSYALALGDLDGDGDLDAFVANSDQANKVWLNNGAGTFDDSGQSLGSSHSGGVALGDLDGDGDLDAFVTNYNAEANKMWLNDGGVQGGTLGTFSDSGQSLGSSFSEAVALGDLDGDGDLDAFVANGGEQANKVWLNNGAGTFSDSGRSLGSSSSYAVALGDLDGDGDLDAFIANGVPANKVWLNDGGVQGGTLGTFSNSGQNLSSLFSQAVALGDLDGDGDLDAFVGSGAPAANKVWLNREQYRYTLYHSDFAKNYDGYTSTLYLQNTALTATIAFLDFYDLTGGSGTTSVSRTIPARGTLIISSDDLSELADEQLYSLIASADQSIESSVHVHAPSSFSDRLAVYRGQNYASTTQYFGPFFGSDETLTSTLLLWNADANDAHFAASFYDTYGTLALIVTGTVASDEQIPYSGPAIPGLPPSFIGTVIVTSDEPMIGLLKLFDQDGETLEYYGALSTEDTSAFLPRALKALDEGGGPRTTALFVFNTSIAQTDATIGLCDATGAVITYSTTLEPYGSWWFDLGDYGALPNDSLWSIIASADQSLAIGEFTSYDAAPFHANGAYETEVDTILNLPGIIRLNDANTAFSVQNTGAVATTLAVDYYDALGNLVFSQTETLPARGWARYNQDQMVKLGNSFKGSVAIRSDQPVKALNEMVIYSAETGPISIYLPLILRNYDPRLPYFDDFGDPDSGWYIDDVGDVRWSYQDGEYEILLRNADWWWDAVLAPLGCVTDYSVEADMRRYSGSTTAYGLIFGWQDWDHLYVFMVEPAYQYYSVWRRAFPGDPYWIPLIDWTPSSYINPANTANHLKVEHNGSQITVYVNNQFLATVNDSAYTGCLQVGLYASTDPASPNVPATVRYDNFQVGYAEATTVTKRLSHPYSLTRR